MADITISEEIKRRTLLSSHILMPVNYINREISIIWRCYQYCRFRKRKSKFKICCFRLDGN